MKIDLHFHSYRKKGGSEGTNSFNFTNNEIYDLVKKNEIGIIGLTNHNKLDIEKYEELKSLFAEKKLNCVLSLGIEKESKLSNNSFHWILHFSDTAIKKLQETKEISFFSNESDLEKISSKLGKMKIEENVIVYPHINKHKSLPKDDLQKFRKIFRDITVIFDVNNKNDLSVINDSGNMALVGSDAKSKDGFLEKANELTEIKFIFKTLEGFILFIKENDVDPTQISNIEEKKFKLILYENRPNLKTLKSIEEIDFIYYKNQINILFGKRGTGKSLILSSLYKSSDSENYDYYDGSKSDILFEDNKNKIIRNFKSSEVNLQSNVNLKFLWEDDIVNPPGTSDFFENYNNWKKDVGKNKFKVLTDGFDEKLKFKNTNVKRWKEIEKEKLSILRKSVINLKKA